MKLFDFFKKSKEQPIQKRNMSSGEWDSVASIDVATGTISKNERKNLKQMLVGTVYTALNKICSEVSTLDFRVRPKGSEKEDVDNQTSPLYQILENPNLNDTKSDFIYKLMFSYLVYGEVYLVRNELRDDKYFVVPASNVMGKVKSRDGTMIVGINYRMGGSLQYATIEDNKLIPIIKSNADYTEGIGIVEKGFKWIETEYNLTDYNLRFLQNGIMGIAFLNTGIDASQGEQLKNLSRNITDKYAGVSQSFRYAALSRGTTFGGKVDSQRAQSIDILQKDIEKKIYKIFSIPLAVMGDVDLQNRANATLAYKVFINRSVLPLASEFIQKFNKAFEFLDESNEIYIGEVDINDIDTKIDITTSWKDSGAFTKNEIRELWNKESMEGGNELPMPPSFNQPEPEERSFKNKLMGMMADIIKGNKMDKWKLYGRQFDEQAQRQANKILPDIERVVDKYRDIAIKNLTKASRMKTRVSTTDLFDEDGFDRDVKAVMVAPMLTFGTKEANKRLKELAGDKVLLEGFRFTPVIDDAIALNTQSYGATTSKQIGNFIGKRTSQGKPIRNNKETREALQELFSITKTRANMLARTTAISVGNRSALEGYRQSEVVSSWRWITAFDDSCPVCIGLHNNIYGVNELVAQRGDILENEDADGNLVSHKQIRDVEAPPIHPRCNCYTVPENIEV